MGYIKKILTVLICGTLSTMMILSGCNVSESRNEETTALQESTTADTTELVTTEPIATEPTLSDVDVADLPDSLSDFLTYFNWGCTYYGADTSHSNTEYDCRHATDGKSNILAAVIHNPPCVRFDEYEGEPLQRVFVGNVSHWRITYDSYFIFNGVKTDWIAENIFNITADELETLYNFAEKQKLFWRETNSENNYDYYFPTRAKGDPFTSAHIQAAKYDGQFYYVSYDMYEEISNDNKEFLGSYFAVVSLKEIDGKEYWSLYQHTENVPDEIVLFTLDFAEDTGVVSQEAADNALEKENSASQRNNDAAWKKLYTDYLNNLDDAQFRTFALINVDDDVIPELCCPSYTRIAGAKFCYINGGELKEEKLLSDFGYVEHMGKVVSSTLHMGIKSITVHSLENGNLKQTVSAVANEYDPANPTYTWNDNSVSKTEFDNLNQEYTGDAVAPKTVSLNEIIQEINAY